jgi:uncharacterized protein YciI
MYVVLLEHKAPRADIDAELPDHSEWIAQHYDAGDFIAAGRRDAQNGDVIIARAMSRGRLEAILATDPFALRKLVKHEVIEFRALRTIPELAKYADHLTPAAGQ